MSRALVVVALAALALAGCHEKAAPSEPAAKPTLLVVATGDVWGQVEPCG